MTMIAVDNRPNSIFDEKSVETSFWTTESHLIERSPMTTKIRIALHHSRIHTTDDAIEAIADAIGDCKFHEIAERIRQRGESIMEKAKDICQEKLQPNLVS